jgi:SAM-dependent methyltransferase
MYIKSYFIQVAKDILIRFPKKVIRFFEYLGEFSAFRKQTGKRFTVSYKDAYPCLKDKLTTTPFDQHYIYHPAWAARKVMQINPAEHVDISSKLYFGTIMSAILPIRFYDYRPAAIQLSNYSSGEADLNKLPFEDNSIESLSCMHTIEHIGLGRYGDVIDGDGDLKAIEELKRVTKVGGSLLFVTPVGQPRVEYNAHRIYSFEQIIDYFAPLTLQEFSLVPDSGGLIENADPALVKQQQYGCGCFWFKKT